MSDNITGKDVLSSEVMVSVDDWSQLISCRDATGRPRVVKVVLDAPEVVLLSPPGEIARLTPDESMFLRIALEDAERERIRRARS